ncbi:hypothetical protein BASA60_007683 [Batrachochytrium salamandrivorans]|nr:hypothetical protein BASA60_007683 [Batrachochytrium salamandrivorans]
MRACRIDPIGDACSDSTATSHEVSHKINDHTRKLIGEFANSSHKFMARRWKARLSSKSSLPRSVHDGLKRLQEVASSSRQTAIRGHQSVPRHSLASRNRLDRDYAFAGYSKPRHPCREHRCNINRQRVAIYNCKQYPTRYWRSRHRKQSCIPIYILHLSNPADTR